MAHRLAQEANMRNPTTEFVGLTESELTTPLVAGGFPGDHAASYETSIAMALNMSWAKMEDLSLGRNPAKVTCPATPQGPDTSHNPRHSLYGIFGEDSRTIASKELGERLVQEIVGRIEKMVDEALLNGS